jgi:hypothetical protein
MRRRDFLKAASALPIVAVLPATLRTVDPLMPFLERGWDFAIAKDFETMWWSASAVFKPTGVRYGWRFAEQFLFDRGMTAETMLAQQLSRVNPYYAS